VNFLLRLKKQIERKMMIELLTKLKARLPITEYRYVGFGSVYYADFILFHKYLGITKMTSLEREEEKKMRFEYNLPYRFVDLKMKSANRYIHEDYVHPDRKIMWLDYDQIIDEDIVDDILTFSSKVAEDDFLFVTVEAEGHVDEEETDEYLEKFGEYNGGIDLTEARDNFPLVPSRIISNVVREGLRSNPDRILARQILNVVYEDTKTMYTYGAFFHSDPAEIIEGSDISSLPFVTEGDDLYFIDCPLLTPKEKAYLDSRIDCQGICQSRKSPTGLTASQRGNYAKFYKYYPQFFESIY